MIRKPNTVLAAIGLLLLALASSLPAKTKKASPKPAQTPSATKSASGKSATSAHRSSHAAAAKRKPNPRAQTAPTPQRISEIQSALAKQGVYDGEPTGKWDAATMDAMQRFQSSHGLSPTGKLDALSLQKLGLGSEVAGRGAPLPEASAGHPSVQSLNP